MLGQMLLRRSLVKICERLNYIYRYSPAASVASTLHGSGWTCQEWAFFHSINQSYPHVMADGELANLVRRADGDFRDLLLAYCIRTDATTRKAMFFSPEGFHQVLRCIAEVVLEKAPNEFRSDNWLASRLEAGAQSFVRLHSLESAG